MSELFHNENFLENWKSEVYLTLQNSKALYIAIFTVSGELLYVNQTMREHFRFGPAKCLVVPTFEYLQKLPIEKQPTYSGLMTIGAADSFNNLSISANVYRKQNQFLIVGELDQTQLLSENNKFIQLNKEVIDLQRKLIKKTKRLENSEQQLKKLVDVLNGKSTELEEANEKLLEMDRLKSVFLASMSHELRTPLNSIIGYTGIMLMGLAGELNEEQIKQLGKVKNNSRHLLNLINDILDISKIEAEKVELYIETINLQTITNKIIEVVTPLKENKKLSLDVDLPEDIEIETDQRRLMQVLINLVTNAIKFTEEGTVNVKARIMNLSQIKICVKDTGIGMSNEDMKKLFIPFQQVDSLLTKKQEGTGLGLYLSKKLVTLLNGTITVRSEINIGSEFCVILPIKYRS